MRAWLIVPFAVLLFSLTGCEEPQQMPIPEQTKSTSSTVEQTTTEQTDHLIEETEESLVSYPSGSLLAAVEA
ncbi:MAG: ankyrin repeat domain-containing protein, partial [Enterococcus faecium]|nr:ankyrin repeat domain-containing protein [Enterococcus faecium]